MERGSFLRHSKVDCVRLSVRDILHTSSHMQGNTYHDTGTPLVCIGWNRKTTSYRPAKKVRSCDHLINGEFAQRVTTTTTTTTTTTIIIIIITIIIIIIIINYNKQCI